MAQYGPFSRPTRSHHFQPGNAFSTPSQASVSQGSARERSSRDYSQLDNSSLDYSLHDASWQDASSPSAPLLEASPETPPGSSSAPHKKHPLRTLIIIFVAIALIHGAVRDVLGPEVGYIGSDESISSEYDDVPDITPISTEDFHAAAAHWLPSSYSTGVTPWRPAGYIQAVSPDRRYALVVSDGSDPEMGAVANNAVVDLGTQRLATLLPPGLHCSGVGDDAGHLACFASENLSEVGYILDLATQKLTKFYSAPYTKDRLGTALPVAMDATHLYVAQPQKNSALYQLEAYSLTDGSLIWSSAKTFGGLPECEVLSESLGCRSNEEGSPTHTLVSTTDGTEHSKYRLEEPELGLWLWDGFAVVRSGDRSVQIWNTHGESIATLPISGVPVSDGQKGFYYTTRAVAKQPDLLNTFVDDSGQPVAWSGHGYEVYLYSTQSVISGRLHGLSAKGDLLVFSTFSPDDGVDSVEFLDAEGNTYGELHGFLSAIDISLLYDMNTSLYWLPGAPTTAV